VRRFLSALAVGVVALAGGTDARALTVFTAVGATTAQAPLWGAIKDGWDAGEPIEVRFWKDLDDLRGVILAGQGDIWVGHLDGLAQAARRGAPVTLLVLTAWADKFRFLTVDPAIASPGELTKRAAEAGEPVIVTPRGSPAVTLMEAARRSGGAAFAISDRPQQQIALELGRGTIRYVEAPEPLASVLTAKFPTLRDVGGLSALHKPAGDLGHGAPMAGVAIRSGLMTEKPERVRALREGMVGWAERNGRNPDAVTAVLPAETLASLGADTVRASLERDPTVVVDAAAAKPLIEETLRLLDGPYPLVPGFLSP